jgi:hypothetical protein
MSIEGLGGRKEGAQASNSTEVIGDEGWSMWEELPRWGRKYQIHLGLSPWGWFIWVTKKTSHVISAHFVE